MTKNHPSSLPWITHALRSMSACLNSISLAWTISSNSENVYCNHNNKTFGCKCSRGSSESTQAQRSVCIGTQPASQSTDMVVLISVLKEQPDMTWSSDDRPCNTIWLPTSWLFQLTVSHLKLSICKLPILPVVINYHEIFATFIYPYSFSQEYLQSLIHWLN